ncbi:6939_t:CDS:2, partial [Gigaspora margarita]
QRVENELNDIKKKIEDLALNYITLSAKLKDIERTDWFQKTKTRIYFDKQKLYLQYANRFAEVPISYSSIESLTPYENVNIYSKAKNPALYLTNVKEVFTKKEDKKEKEKTIEERIKEI